MQTVSNDALSTPLPSTDCWLLNPWQREAVDRVVSRCRQTQNGFLLNHRVGSGKTLTMLSIAFNSTPQRKKLIICPKNLMGGYDRKSNDVQGLVGDSSHELKKFFAQIKVLALEDFLMMCITDPKQVIKMCANKFVGVDEAHNIARFVRGTDESRRQDVLGVLQQAFAGTRRIVMMTGTPIVKNQSDLTMLLSMLCRSTSKRPCLDFPVTDEAFSSMYMDLTEEGLEKRAYSQLRITLADAAKGIPLDKAARLVAYSGLTAGISTLSSYLGVPIPVEYAGWAGFFAYHSIKAFVNDKLMNPVIDKLKQEISGTQFKSLNTVKMTEDWERYISYFDYETNTSTMRPSLDFPSYKEIYASYPYSFLQAEILMKIQTSEFTMSDRDKRSLGMVSTEEIKDLDTFKRYACRLSDVSYDSGDTSIQCRWQPQQPPRNTEWKYPLTNGVNRAVGTYVIQKTKTVETKTTEEEEFHRPPSYESKFSCPKFEKALHIISHYATNPHHMEDVDDEMKVPHFYETYKGTSKESARLQSYTKKLIPSLQKRRVVIVYPRFTRTMEEFSAFLSDSNVPHVVVTQKTTDIESMLAQAYPLLKDDPALSMSDRSRMPVCAILHPDLIEGLNCTFNPALIVLDTIDGVGIKEQVHGRVLRNLSYHSGIPYDEEKLRPLENTDRWPKRIFQLKAVHDKGFLRLSNNFDAAMSTYTSKVANDTFERPLTDLTNSGYCRLGLRGLHTSVAGRGLQKYIVDITGFHYKSALMRSQHELPEDLVQRSNEEQYATLNVIQKIFTGTNDNDLAAFYCNEEETCTPCDACSCGIQGCSIVSDE
jgi:hypothetical protein